MLPELGEIGKRRRQAGMTQQQLASCAGISQSLVAKIESGTLAPSYENVKRIFECFEREQKKAGRSAGEIASRKIFYAKPEETVEKAIETMRKHGFSQLPVLRQGRIVGSISDENIVGFLRDGKEAGKAKVEDIMGEPFARISKDAQVEAVVGLLKYEKAIVVTEGEEVKGIITRADLFKLF
ncbi:Zinc metalloprotease [Candidatus Anstonella stagnisolia]|nr:Zinc metalloprotease [Candidatus Anstonella stagnisolia]